MPAVKFTWNEYQTWVSVMDLPEGYTEEHAWAVGNVAARGGYGVKSGPPVRELMSAVEQVEEAEVVDEPSPDAYDSTPARGSELVWTRVYRAAGKTAHLREVGSSCPVVLRYLPKAEGDFAGQDSWLGTGSQEEYEQALRLPLCPKCFAAREAGHTDPRLGTGHGVEMT